MRAGESRQVIKKMQSFMDKLDKNVLDKKILNHIKVKHVAAAFFAYKTLSGMGRIESAETGMQSFIGGIEAVSSMGLGASLLKEKHYYSGGDSDRSALNRLVMTATHFMVSQVENGQSLYDKDGKYVGTIVNRYDDEGKIISSEPVYQVKKGIKSTTKEMSAHLQNMMIKSKHQNG